MQWFSKAVFAGLLFVFLSSSAYSQSDLGFKGIGAKFGLVDPENIDAVIGFGVFGDFGEIKENIRLEGNLDYWSKSYGDANFDASISDFALTGMVKYMFSPDNESFQPFVGGGLGLHFISSSWKSKVENPIFDTTKSSDSSTKIGIDLGGGVFYGVSDKIDLLGEVRYRLVSDVSQFTVQIGALYKLGE